MGYVYFLRHGNLKHMEVAAKFLIKMENNMNHDVQSIIAKDTLIAFCKYQCAYILADLISKPNMEIEDVGIKPTVNKLVNVIKVLEGID